MGRITKSKIEKIQSLLKEGHLQKEVAEIEGVNVRTVSKYDPQRKSRTVTGKSTKRQLEALNELARTLLDWFNMKYWQDPLTQAKLECPKCENTSLCGTELGQEFFYLCVKCGYRLIWPWEICRQCFYQGEMKYDSKTEKHLCPECGYPSIC